MSAALFHPLLLLHIACVALSGTLFTVSALARLAGASLAGHRGLRLARHLIDTVLFGAAIALAVILRLDPLNTPWLGVKLLLVLLYIVLGSLALRRTRTRPAMSAAFLAALAVFALIIGIAVTQSPWSWWAMLSR